MAILPNFLRILFGMAAMLAVQIHAQLAGEALATRTFKLPPNAFSNTLSAPGFEFKGPLEPAPEPGSLTAQIQSFFKAAGIEPPADALSVRPAPNEKAMFVNERTRQVTVRSTLAELDKIERAFAAMTAPVPQVSVEARFIEAPADYILLTPRRLAASAMSVNVLTEAQYREAVQALEKTERINILTPPAITTVSGRQARLRLEETPTPIILTPPPLPRDTRPDADPTPNSIRRLPLPPDFVGGV